MEKKTPLLIYDPKVASAADREEFVARLKAEAREKSVGLYPEIEHPGIQEALVAATDRFSR